MYECMYLASLSKTEREHIFFFLNTHNGGVSFERGVRNWMEESGVGFGRLIDLSLLST